MGHSRLTSKSHTFDWQVLAKDILSEMSCVPQTHDPVIEMLNLQTAADRMPHPELAGELSNHQNLQFTSIIVTDFLLEHRTVGA